MRKKLISFVAAFAVVAMLALAACSPSVDQSATSDSGADAATSGIDYKSMGYTSFFETGNGDYTEDFLTTEWMKDGQRGCNACHENLWDAIDGLSYLKHLASSAPSYGKNANWTDCFR